MVVGAPGYEPGGREFESLRARQIGLTNKPVSGYTPNRFFLSGIFAGAALVFGMVSGGVTRSGRQLRCIQRFFDPLRTLMGDSNVR